MDGDKQVMLVFGLETKRGKQTADDSASHNGCMKARIALQGAGCCPYGVLKGIQEHMVSHMYQHAVPGTGHEKRRVLLLSVHVGSPALVIDLKTCRTSLGNTEDSCSLFSSVFYFQTTLRINTLKRRQSHMPIFQART